MLTEQFNYHLPPELIAQEPLADRLASRLMVVKRQSNSLTHCYFKELINFLNPGDCLVINETKVRPARIKAQKSTGAAVELLLLKEQEPAVWEALARPAKRLKKGDQIFINTELKAEVVAELTAGRRLVKFSAADGYSLNGSLKAKILQAASLALPPYIHKPLKQPKRYQTVYSRHLGSVAAPTAGLHFTEAYLKELEAKGVKLAKVVLHIGLGTFRPIASPTVENHKMHAESYNISIVASTLINETKNNGGRVVAVGTTVVRALESAAKNGKVQAEAKDTELFIYPGYQFQVVDALLTNFHLPKSTLLVLVSAFAGLDLIKQAYGEAVKQRYRFYSFGDAMLIL
jgi:S-adenosylmethionine:tRNA ribosyltransferase-isomerase